MINFFKKRKKGPENWQELLIQFQELEKRFEKIAEEFENMKKENCFFIKKVGIIRFNPFSDTGGNQSFSIVLLNSNDDGVIITSLYSREGNRVYGKPIRGGTSEYPLSNEEKEAIEKAKAEKNEGKNSRKFNPPANA